MVRNEKFRIGRLLLIPGMIIANEVQGSAAPVRQSSDLSGSAALMELHHPVTAADSLAHALASAAEGAMRTLMASSPTVDSPPGDTAILMAIQSLDGYAAFLPGHDWISGHRVGLRVMRGELAEALQIAETCGFSRSWCAMLSGYALHLMEDITGAETAFDAAFAEMSSEERCRWNADVQLLLSGAMAREFRNADCAGRLALEARIWWLSDPLYLVPGNDRRTEHFARAVAMHLHHQALAVVGHSCTDHHAAEIRSGWAQWEISYLLDAPEGHSGYTFVPGEAAGTETMESDPADWTISPATGWERYDPFYGPVYELPDLQVGTFLRGDSMIVLGATDVNRLPIAGKVPSAGGMVVMLDELDRSPFVAGEGSGDRFVFRTERSAEPHLVGIEVLTADDGAARARLGVEPPTRSPGELTLSDVVLFEWEENLREDLNTIAPRISGGERLQRGENPGIFWEVYGLNPGDELDLSVVVAAKRPGFFGRLASALGLRRLVLPVSIRWEEEITIAEADFIGRSLQLGIEHLPAGEYTLEASVRRPGGVTTTRARNLIIEG